MSDAPLLDTFFDIAAIKHWNPDRDCIAAGDEHVTAAVRCYAAAGLCNATISQRIRLFAVDADPPERHDAAIALARHAAFAGAPARQIAGCLARLAIELPDWLPDNPDEIASLTRAALREAGR